MADPPPIFEGGKLKPGIYKIQNIVSQTYLEVRDHSQELCCRPFTALENGKGLWEILPSGPGYTIRRVDPGKPKQYCMMLDELGGGTPISVAAFPVPWRVAVVKEERYRDHEYIQFFWGTTSKTWDLEDYGSDIDRTQVKLVDNNDFQACRIWKLVPMQLNAEPQPVPEVAPVNPAPGLGPLPPYGGNPRNQCCTCHHQTAETEDDGFGTTVIEVTTTTNTVTTRKKYRVEED